MGIGNDDFLVSRNIDESKPCTSISQIEWDFIILPIGASISLLCYFYLLWMYFIVNSPLLKRHPTTLAIYKAIFSIIYVQQYLWLPFYSSVQLYESSSADDQTVYKDCVASSGSGVLAFITQFSLIASQMCFLVISIDLRNAYTNPFTSYQQNRIYFAVLVIAFSLFTGFMLLIMGPRVYGPSSEGTVWIQNRRITASLTFVWPKFILFYFIIFLIYCYSIWANFLYSNQAKAGKFSKSFQHRLSIMERSRKYTIGYILYEFITIFCELISYIVKDSRVFYSLPSYFYCLQGLWDLSVILYSNWSEITADNINPITQSRAQYSIAENVAQEGLLLQPHLNTALRAEILYFTTQGIMFSAQNVDPYLPLNENGHFITFDEYENLISPVCFSFDEDNESSNDNVNGNENGNGNERSATLRITRSSSNRLDPAKDTNTRSTNSAPSSKASSYSRSTIFEIDKFNKAQDAAVSSISEAALRSEYEKLGISNRGSARARESTNSLTANPLISPVNKRNSNALGFEEEKGPSPSPTPISPTRGSLPDNPIPSSSSKAERKMSMMKRASNLGSNIGSPGTLTISDNKESSMSRIESVRIGITRAINTASNTLLMSAYDSFRFKDFCPSFFKEIRGLCGVDEDEYSSVFTSTTKERFSEGRSGAFMFFSANQKYIVKTTVKGDMCSLYRILPKYVEYLRKNPNSLIVRFLGAHNITMYGVKLYFVVMLNVFTSDNLSERYDLKGSWVNRHGFKGGRNATGLGRGDKKSSSVPLYQDNDLQHKISLHPDVIRPFAQQVKMDSEFLRDNRLMDYSLLIGVKRERFTVIGQTGQVVLSNSSGSDLNIESSDRPSNQQRTLSKDTSSSSSEHLSEFSNGFQARVVEGPGVYFFGIIDILQEFNFMKSWERFAKVWLKFQDPLGISAMEPVAYADRFWRRCIVDTFEGLEDTDLTESLRESLRVSYAIQEEKSNSSLHSSDV